MASIIKKIKKGRPYYYAVESKRVDGKPRIVWQKYLGTVEGMVARAEEARPERPKEAVIFELGGVAALLRIAQRLGVKELIDEAVPKREQGPSVGHYLLLAAINRALAPCSKLGIADWYETTVLRRLWRFPASAFSSQRFWDHMDMVSEEAIEEIGERLIPRIRAEFGLHPDLLLYDTTNFFTFISTTNSRADLPARGHSKAGRGDLRQVGLALLVTRDFQVPLAHRLYAGNVPDVTLFHQMAGELLARYRALGGEASATLVMDKGNVSDDAMEELVVGGGALRGGAARQPAPGTPGHPRGGFPRPCRHARIPGRRRRGRALGPQGAGGGDAYGELLRPAVARADPEPGPGGPEAPRPRAEPGEAAPGRGARQKAHAGGHPGAGAGDPGPPVHGGPLPGRGGG